MFRSYVLLTALLIALTGCNLNPLTNAVPKSTSNEANREVPIWRIVNPVQFHERDGVVFSEEGRGIDCSKTKNSVYFSGEVAGVEWIGAVQCDTEELIYFANVYVAIKGLQNDQVPFLTNGRPTDPESQWAEMRYVSTNTTKNTLCVDSDVSCQEANTKLINHPAYSHFTADSSQTLVLSSTFWFISQSDFNYGLFDPWVGIEQNHEPSSLADTSHILFEGTNYENVLALNTFTDHGSETSPVYRNKLKAVAIYEGQVQRDVELHSSVLGVINEKDRKIEISLVNVMALTNILDTPDGYKPIFAPGHLTYILDTGKETKWYDEVGNSEDQLLYTYTREELSNFSIRIRTPYKLESMRQADAYMSNP